MKKIITLIIFMMFGTMAFGIEITPLAGKNNDNIKSLKDAIKAKEVRKNAPVKIKIGGVEVTDNNTKFIYSYTVSINGQKYYMVKNKPNNDYNIGDILGFNDNKSELFKDLKSLNSDSDKSEITNNELKRADIRFVALKNGKLLLRDRFSDYKLKYVQYISLNSLRGSIKNGKRDSFGHFDIYVKDKNTTRKYIGTVSFETEEVLKDLISQ